MTEASKKTRSLGQVHGLFTGRRASSQMFGMEPRSHHATTRFTVPAIIVPTNCAQRKNM